VIGALRTAAANFRARRGMFLASGLAFNFMRESSVRPSV